ncbi:MAG: 2-dehydropantoate 2-reductase [SAR324 cluster bacterium]|nr:2-dehydropantoate 2-reductase [SAR324 cluster bacterium]
MKFAIVGAGAIGGLLGAKLARAGEDVALIARGSHLAAIRERGLRLEAGENAFTVHPPVSDDPAEIGVVDVVIIALKAHSLPPFVERLKPLLGVETTVVTAMNGLPWWYFYRHGGEWEGTTLSSLDPGGVIANTIGVERVMGCIVFPSAEIPAPGVIRHVEGNRFSLGEPDGAKSERAVRISQALIGAGFRAPIRTRIRHDIWVKLIGNMVFNPLSALTGATLREIAEHPPSRELAREMMIEAIGVAEKLGIELDITVDQRIEGARKVGGHKTSMLQDLEAGKPLELECMVGAVLELGRLVRVPMPRTEAVYAAAKLLDQVRAQGR